MTFDLNREMRAYGLQKEIAKALGVSVARVSAMQTGRKPPTDALLALLGWEKTTTTTIKRRKKEVAK